MELSPLQKDLLGYSSNDDMGLWIIPWRITNSGFTGESDASVRNQSITIIRGMLENGWLAIGMPIDNDGKVVFQLFSMSVDESIEFIESEWDKLSGSSTLGDICWFRATPKGKQLAVELGLLD
jgi:hypothetical protein